MRYASPPVGDLRFKPPVPPEPWTEPMQAGMLDIVMSLKWVKDNIERFGRDPGNVTIFGESGGGRKVAMLMAMEPARGLFHKAIIESGSGLDAPSKEEAVALERELLKNLDISEGDTEALMSTDAKKIFDARPQIPGSAGDTPGQLTVTTKGFVPCIDGIALKRKPFIPDAPAVSADITLLIGSNKDEESIFRAGNPGYGTYTDEDFVKYVRKAFARKGDPNTEVLPRWPVYNKDTRRTMVFDTECRIWEKPFEEIRKILVE